MHWTADQWIQWYILHDADPEEFSDAQLTDLLAAYFIEDADAEADVWLSAPDPEDGLRIAA